MYRDQYTPVVTTLSMLSIMRLATRGMLVVLSHGGQVGVVLACVGVVMGALLAGEVNPSREKAMLKLMFQLE